MGGKRRAEEARASEAGSVYPIRFIREPRKSRRKVERGASRDRYKKCWEHCHPREEKAFVRPYNQENVVKGSNFVGAGGGRRL